ncbi:MAG TPA: aminotransferase class V-fold PLP-dependent enzyme [Alphaproteobacteria bacterium]|nr:aminotransferase class V-fold PLP-dependent enzyme [Alphaproteobacteria bacterium]
MEPIYLDYQATTPLDPRVLEAMLPWWGARFGNPHSTGHARGRDAGAAVEAARAEVAALIGGDPREIVFTSGATEANNLAIKGAARFHRRRGDHVVTVATEHKCVLESVRALEAEGFRTTILPVGPDGLLDLDRLAAALDDRTLLVSVMLANNEIGTIQPLAEIARIAHAAGALVHTDAAQAAGKIPVDVAALDVDLMSLSAHKLYGPQGIGALWLRRRPRARIAPLFDGGGQERGLRSGTVPTPLAVGFGAACAVARAEMPAESARIAALRDRLAELLVSRLAPVYVNGHPTRRLPGNLSIGFAGVEATRLLAALPELALSAGSACTSAAVEPSYVVRALGRDDGEAAATVRIALGRFTTAGEVERAAELLIGRVTALRAAPGLELSGMGV